MVSAFLQNEKATRQPGTGSLGCLCMPHLPILHVLQLKAHLPILHVLQLQQHGVMSRHVLIEHDHPPVFSAEQVRVCALRQSCKSRRQLVGHLSWSQQSTKKTRRLP